jgi:CBS domain-containing protein
MSIDIDKLDYIASPDDLIEETWTKFESNRHRSVIVVEDGRLVGTLSDGDIRKAILKHRLLSTPIREVMNLNFISITESQRCGAEEIFKKHDIYGSIYAIQ